MQSQPPSLPPQVTLAMDPATQAILELRRRAAGKELQRRKLIPFTAAFTNEYQPGWVHREIAEHLEAFMEAVERKLSPRLMIFLPPRLGKTQLVSRCFPAFMLGHHPSWEIICATFGQELADDIGRYVRTILNDPEYKALFPDTKIQAGSNAADRMDTTARGGYRALGRGGSLTGRGAHCIAAGQLVETETGPVPIELVIPGDRVWSWNPGRRVAELRTVQATKVTRSQPVVRLDTSSPYTFLRCTNAHLIYSDGTYTKAHDLTPGSPLLTLPHHTVPEERTHKVLQQGVLLRPQAQGGPYANLLALRRDRSRQSHAPQILREGLQECSPLELHAGAAELELARRPGDWSHQGVQEGDGQGHPGDRRGLCELRERRQTRMPSPGREQEERRVREPSDVVRDLPHSVPQVHEIQYHGRHDDGVADVYDLQVEENHNFFASGILVHNCLIIDDPLKDDAEADSALIQDGLRSWYSTSARSRLSPGGGVIIVQTLWSLNDLPLFLLEAQGKDPLADKWLVYKYPAIATCDEPNRKKGEALHPERFDVAALEKTRANFYSQGLSRWWNSLYQQSPVNEEGDFFKSDWVRYYDALPAGELNWYMGVDYAVSKSNVSDQTAIVRFAVDNDYNIYIDPQIFHERCSSLDAVNKVLALAKQKGVFSIGSEKGVIENAIGPLWEQRCKETKHYPFVHKLTRSQGKHIYAATLQGRMQQGKVFFPRTKFVEEVLVPELLAFRAGVDNKHDNLVDALTNGLLMLNEVLPGHASKTSTKDADTGIVPGSYEDLHSRKHVDPTSLAPKREVSLHAWRKKVKPKKYW